MSYRESFYYSLRSCTTIFNSASKKVKLSYTRCTIYCYKEKTAFVESPFYKKTSQKAKNVYDGFSSFCHNHQIDVLYNWLLLNVINASTLLFGRKVRD